MHKYSIFYRQLFYFFIVLNIEALYASESIECKDDAVLCFEEYRLAVDSGSSNLFVFFSKSVNEEWLNSLNKVRPAEEQLAALGSVRSKASFSRRICTVNQYEIKKEESGVLLSVIYTTHDGKGPYLYEVSYVNQLGSLLIASTLSDTTIDTGSYGDTVVAEFCKN